MKPYTELEVLSSFDEAIRWIDAYHHSLSSPNSLGGPAAKPTMVGTVLGHALLFSLSNENRAAFIEFLNTQELSPEQRGHLQSMGIEPDES